MVDLFFFVLGFCAVCWLLSGRGETMTDKWQPNRWHMAVDFARRTRGGWWHGQATHWMPLPEPPKEAPQ